MKLQKKLVTNTKTRLKLISYHLLLGLIIFQSCSTYTKQEYLSDYQKLIYDIKANWRTYEEDDWKKFDIQNELFSHENYNKFNLDLTSSEKLRVRRFDFAYHFYRGDITAAMILSDNYKEILGSFYKEILAIFYELEKFQQDIRTEYMAVIIEKIITQSL